MMGKIEKFFQNPIFKVVILTMALVFIFSHFRTDVSVMASDERVSVFPQQVTAESNLAILSLGNLGTSSSLWSGLENARAAEAMPAISLSEFKSDWAAEISFGNFVAANSVVFDPQSNSSGTGSTAASTSSDSSIETGSTSEQAPVENISEPLNSSASEDVLPTAESSNNPVEVAPESSSVVAPKTSVEIPAAPAQESSAPSESSPVVEQGSSAPSESSSADGSVSMNFWQDLKKESSVIFGNAYGFRQASAQETNSIPSNVATSVLSQASLGEEKTSLVVQNPVLSEEKYQGLKDSLVFTNFVSKSILEKNEITNVQLRLSLAGASNFANDEFLIEYSLTGDNWEEAGRLPLFREASNASNGGYFLYAMPLFSSWKNLSNLQVRISYLNPDISSSTDLSAGGVKVYLDSVWLEVDYALKGKVKGEEEKLKNENKLGKKLFYDQDEIDVEGKKIKFEYTDDNSDESLIIKTDRANYVGLSETEVYLSVTNASDQVEQFGLQTYFPEQVGNVESVEKLNREAVEATNPVLGDVKLPCSVSWLATSTTGEGDYLCADGGEKKQCSYLEDSGLTCVMKDAIIGTTPDVIVEDSWEKTDLNSEKLADNRNIVKKIFGIGPKKKSLPAGFKVKKSTAAEQYSIEPGETQFFKVKVSFPQGSNGEFYFEAVGQGAYGLLDPWWNASWDYERPVNITFAGEAQTNYQTSIFIDTAALIAGGKMQGDCDDIRFADSNRWAANNELSYYLEPGSCNRTNTRLWVKVPLLTGNKTIYMYYGNAAANTGSNGVNTFVYFQDFESNHDFSAGTMTLSRPSKAVKNGLYGLYGYGPGTRGIQVRNGFNSGRNLIWESSIQALSSSTIPVPGIQIAHPNGQANLVGYTAYLDTRGGVDLGIRKDYDAAQILASYSTYTINTNQWYFLQFSWRKDGLLSAYVYSSPTSTTALAYCSSTNAVYTDGEYGVAAQDYNYWDDYRIRKLATSSVTTALASEVLITNHPPTNPISLAQYSNGTSTAMLNGAWSGSQSIYLFSTSTDKDGDLISNYYQLVATTTAFSTATSVPSTCPSGTAFNSCASKIWSSRGSSLPSWLDTDFPFRSKITILNSKVDADLTNFPVYIDLARMGATNSLWQSVRSSAGGDLVITNSTGTRLPLEVVGFSTSTKSGQIYFKADILRDLTDTDFYLYYGSSTASQPASSTAYGSRNVWTGYNGVWHLDNNGTGASGDWRDSSANSNYSSTTANYPARVAGPLGYGQQFDGVNDIIRFEKSSTMEPATDFTLSAWVWWGNQSSGYVKPIHYGQDGTAPYGSYMFQTNNTDESQVQFQVGKTVPENVTATGMATGTWAYMTGVYGYFANKFLYVNGGNERASSTSGANAATVYNVFGLSFGAQGNGVAAFFNGRIDEVRLYPGVRSQQWVNTEYNNQNNIGTFISTSSQETVAWFDTDYAYRLKITAKASQVNADLVNFPIYVNLSRFGAGNSFWTNSKNNSDGGDLLVTNARGTRLPVEVVAISTSSKTGEVYFKADAIKDLTDTDFYLYYGSSTASQPASSTAYGVQNVWSNNYKAVWHLNSVSNVLDSSGTCAKGVNNGVSNSASGKLGSASSFTGAGQYLDITAPTTGLREQDLISAGLAGATWSAWANPTDDWDTIGSRRHIVCKGDFATQDWAVFVETNYTVGNEVWSGGWNFLNTTKASWNANQWYYLTNTIIPNGGAGGNYYWYVDGAQDKSSTYAASIVTQAGNPNINIGRHSAGVGGQFGGLLDEVRISNVVRSGTWISTEYNNQNNPAAFLATSTAENYANFAVKYVNVPGVPESPVGYKWQVISCDNRSICSMWVPYNSTLPNFSVDTVSPTVPGNLTLNKKANTSVVLNFGATTTEANFQEYKIFYKAGISGVTESDTRWGSSSDANLGNILFNRKATTTITGLTAGTQYVFKIYAYDLYGRSAGSASELTITTSGYPGDAENLEQYLVGATPLANGGWTYRNTVNLFASSSAEDIYYELIPIGSTFKTATTTPGVSCPYDTTYANCAGKLWKNSLSWYDSDFSYRTKITALSSAVTADFTNYPLYVDLSTLGASHPFWSHVRSTGGDILMTNADGTRLPVEVVSVNTTAKTGEVYFKSDMIEDATSTDFYIYYGSSTAAQPASSSAYGYFNVWPKEFGAVYHFQGGNFKNSASSSWNGVGYNGIAASTTGRFGNSISCDGVNDYAEIPDAAGKSPFEDNTTGFTVAVWGREKAGVENDAWIMDKDVTGWRLWTRGSSIQFNIRNLLVGWSGRGTSTPPLLNTWYSVVATMNNTQTSQDLYIDNHAGLTGAIAARLFDDVANNLHICSHVDGSNNWPGQVDELRVIRAERTAASIATQYNNQSSNNTFFATSTEVNKNSVKTNNIPVSGITDSATGYKWQVLGCNTDGCSEWSKFNVATPNFLVDTTAPTRPGNLTLDSRDGAAITLNFGSASTESNWQEYKIFYKAGTTGVTEGNTLWGSSSVAVLASRTYSGFGSTTITGLMANTNYVFNIWAYDLAGNKASATTEISAKTFSPISNPNTLQQWKNLNTTIPNNGWTNSSTVSFMATSSAAEGAVDLYYQVIGTTSSFTTSTSTPASSCSSGTGFAGCASKIWNNIGWFDTDYPYRTNLVVQSSKVTADQTNFPVYVNLANLGANHSFWSHTKKNSDGGDLMITNSTGVRLPLEIVSISTSTKTGEAYFKADTLSSSGNTTFYLYYGSSTAAQPAAANVFGKYNVWSNGYAGVWHLSETGTGAVGDYKNSALAVNNSINTTLQPTRLASGKMGAAQTFTAANSNYIEIANDATLNPAAQISLSAWFYSNSWGNNRRVLQKGATDNQYRLLREAADNNFMFEVRGPSVIAIATSSPVVGSWHYTVGAYNGATLALYSDGTLENSTLSTGAMAVSADNLFVGTKNAAAPIGDHFDGNMDELRVANIGRSATWISTEYNNQNAPQTFYATSSETAYSNSANRVSVASIPDSADGYRWQVLSCNVDGCSKNWVIFNASAPNFSVDTVAPATPGNLSIDGKNATDVTLNFGSLTTDYNFAEYKIFYKPYTSGATEANGLWGQAQDADLASRTFNGTGSTTVINLSASTTYYFNIWAYDLAGNATKAVTETFTTTSGGLFSPNSLQQYKALATPLANGNWTNSSTVSFQATSSNSGGEPYIYYELITNATSFRTATTTPANPCYTNTTFGSCTNKIWTDIDPQWWNRSWTYRRKITFGTTHSLLPTGYTASTTIDTRTGSTNVSLASGNDVRVVWQLTGGTPLEIDRLGSVWNNATTNIQFRLQTDIATNSSESVNGSYYIYYNNAAAGVPKASSSNVFYEYDDFDNNSLGAEWTTTDNDQTAGTAFVESSSLRILANGSDVWTPPNDYYGAIFRNVPGNFEATVRIIAQGTSDAWAKSGIMVKNNMTVTQANNGYGIVAVTPGSNFTNQWDLDGDGYLESYAVGGVTAYPDCVRLVKTGGDFQGYYSTNCTSFTSLGSFTPYSVNATQNVGLFTTAHANGVLNPTWYDWVKIIRTTSDKEEAAVGTEERRAPVKNPTIVNSIPDSSSGYKWQAITCNQYSCSAWIKFNASIPNFVVDTLKPTKPGSLTLVTRRTNSLTLGFGAATTEANFQEYKIFYHQGPTVPNEADTLYGSSTEVKLGSRTYSNGTTTVISGLLPNTQYTFNIWSYDLSGQKASATAVTLQTSNTVTETYVYTSGASAGWTNPSYAWDIVDDTYAYRSIPANSANDSASYLLGTANNAPNSTKTILGVELGIEGYSGDPDVVNYKIVPVFSGLTRGATSTILGTQFGRVDADGTYYVDITKDAQAPGTWTWNDIINLDARVHALNSSTTNVTAYVDQIRLRVSVDSYPELTTNLSQRPLNSTSTLSANYWFNQSALVLRADGRDPDTAEMPTVFFQFVPTTTAFISTTSKPTAACISGTAYASCPSKVWLVNYVGAPADFSATPFVATSAVVSIPDGSYKWQAITCDDDDICSTAWTNFSSATSTHIRIDTTPPTIPGWLRYVSRTSGSLTLQFGTTTAETNFNSYKIFYRKSSTTVVTELDSEFSDTNLLSRTFNGASTTTVAGLAKSSFYTFNIWAYDRAGNKASSTRMLIASTTSGYTLTQTSCIIENDDGATANLNTAPGIADTQLTNVEKGQRLIARFQLQNTGTDQTYNKRFKIQYENNTDAPGSWYDVGGSTGISYGYGLFAANGDALTARKAAANANTWVNGIWQENTNLTNMYNLPKNDYTEFAFALQTANALPGKTYRLRLIDGTGSSTFDVYTSYPTLVISSSANKKYSKNSPSSLLTTNADLTFFLDNPGYTNVSSDNAVREAMPTSPAYMVYNFATKHKDYNSAITATWNGQSTVAPSTNTVYLQIYRFGTTNAWVTMSSDNSAAANTDLTLTGSVGYKMAEYYDANGYVYWRAYQATGNQSLSTDYYNLATSSLVSSVGQKHYRWRFDNGNVAQGGWYNDDYVYRKKLTLDPNLIPGSGTLTNFPVLISFTDNDLRGTSSGGYVQGYLGWDIVFANASGTQIKLDHQIEKYVPATGELIAWVEVPAVYAEKDTPIYIYYGNATTSASQANNSGTWMSNYKAVWHFDETGASTTRLDSTANGNNATPKGYEGDEDGFTNIDGTEDFDGVNDHLTVADSNSLDITNGLTVSGWFNPDTTAKPLDLTAAGYAQYQIVGMRWTAAGDTDCIPDASVEPSRMNPYDGAMYGSPTWLANSSWKVYDTTLAGVYGGYAAYQIDFVSLWGAAVNNSEFYVTSYLYSPRTKQVTFSVGSDDSRTIWINGHRVNQDCAGQGLTIDDQSFNYTLKQGWNTFVMFVANGGGNAGSQWRVSSSTDGLKYTSNPRILLDKKEYQVSLKGGYLSAFYGTTTVDYAISSSSWQNFALVGDSANVELFLNGLSRASSTFSSVATANTEPIRMGYLFDGKLDEMRVLDSKASKDWIGTSYNNQANTGTGSGKFIKAITSQQVIVSTVATWREAEDTGDPTLGTAITKNSNIRLHLSAANTSGGIAANYNLRLQYASTSINCAAGIGAWYDVPTFATTQHFEMSSSTWIVNGDPTARELINAEGYTYVDGSTVEEIYTTSTMFTLGQDQYTESEWALRPTNNASNGATYCFRAVRAAGTLLDYYDRYAELTLSGNTNTAPSFTFLPGDGNSATSTPTLYGTNVSFSALATDAQTNEYYLAVCKTDSIVTGNGTTPSCPGGAWCISNLASSSVRANCSAPATSSSESFPWYAFACDLKWGAGVSKCSVSSQGETPQQASSSPFKINHRPTFTALNTTVNFRDPGGSFTVAASGIESDIDGPDDTISFYACNTNSATFATGCASGQTLCSSTAAVSSNPSCSFTDVAPTPPGANTYYGFVFDSHGASSTVNSRSSTYSVNNVIPVLGSLVLNGGSPISLNIKGAPDTTVQTVNASVTDQNGCQSLVSATGVVYLSSAFSSYNCAANNNNCYQINTSNCVLSNCSGPNDAIGTYTCTASFKYYAIPTDNSTNNPWVADTWISRLQVFDGSNYVATNSPAVELNTNSAIDITENAINFGSTMNPGDNTGAVNQQVTVVNYGNSPLNSDLSGTNMRGNGSAAISVSKIQWSLVGFNYGAGTALPKVPQLVNLVLPKPTTATDVTDLVYWGLALPATTTSGTFEGSTTMAAVLDNTDW